MTRMWMAQAVDRRVVRNRYPYRTFDRESGISSLFGFMEKVVCCT